MPCTLLKPSCSHFRRTYACVPAYFSATLPKEEMKGGAERGEEGEGVAYV